MALPCPPSLKRPVGPRSNVQGSDVNSSFESLLQSSGSGGRSGGTTSSLVPQPSAFRDLSNMDTPDDLTGLFKACRHLSRWSAVHKAYVSAMATFPITDLVIKSAMPSSDALRKVHEETPGINILSDDYATGRMQTLIDKHWKLKKVNQEVARAFFTYSNAVITISYPFIKILKCTKCEHQAPALESSWSLRAKGIFHWECPACKYSDRADVFDQFIDDPEGVRFLILDVERIAAVRNEFRNETDLYYEITQDTIDRIKKKPLDKKFVCETPQSYLEAALGKPTKGGESGDYTPRVKLRKDLTYHLRSSTLQQATEGMAFPEMAATLKDYWLLRILQKAQEAIASDYIVPLRFIYPEASARSGNLFEMINVPTYMDVLRREVSSHRMDPNYMPVVPFPVGYQTLGGEAKALMLAQEIRVIMEQICSGLGCPLEFLFGGLSYSGSNVSIQQQEVKFRDFRQELLAFNRWAVDHITNEMSLPRTVIEHKEFKMGDDAQRMQMLSMFQQSNVTSMKRLHDELGVDSHSEQQQILSEVGWLNKLNEKRMKAEASMQEQSMVRQMAAQAEGMVRGTEAQLSARAELAKVVRADPELYSMVKADPQLVMQIFGPMSQEGAAMGPGPNQQMTTPDPEELAPGAGQEAAESEEQAEAEADPVAMSPRHLRSLIMSMASGNVENDQRQDDPIRAIVLEFQDLPAAYWPERISQVRQQYGNDVAQQVTAKLAEAQMLMLQKPDQLPSRREGFGEFPT